MRRIVSGSCMLYWGSHWEVILGGVQMRTEGIVPVTRPDPSQVLHQSAYGCSARHEGVAKGVEKGERGGRRGWHSGWLGVAVHDGAVWVAAADRCAYDCCCLSARHSTTSAFRTADSTLPTNE